AEINHTRRSNTPLRAGQFVSRAYVVLLRKSIPQSRNLKTAAELNVTWGKEFLHCANRKECKSKTGNFERMNFFWFCASESLSAVA
ncbi:MAG TPA: hypothetical protein DIW64_14885, partial [Cellvibrio sp.]|nr:hypothetical protein [Cellvibrio sp.]